MRTAFIESLCEMARHDERLWLLTGDLGFSVLERFADRFPERYVNVGVAEQNMIGVATGLALSGKVVFVYSIANFPTLRCLEQIRNDVCCHDANVKIVAVGGGVSYGPLGYTHHAVEDLAVMRALPNMTVIAPGDPVEARLATRAAADWSGPCYIRLGKAGETVVHSTAPSFKIGEAIVYRPGVDVTLISTGGMLKTAVECSERLVGEGVSAGVVSMHTVKPLDEGFLAAEARRVRLICTIEEHGKDGGLADAVASSLSSQASARAGFLGLTLGEKTHQLPIGSQTHILKTGGLDALHVKDQVMARLSGSGLGAQL